MCETKYYFLPYGLNHKNIVKYVNFGEKIGFNHKTLLILIIVCPTMLYIISNIRNGEKRIFFKFYLFYIDYH